MTNTPTPMTNREAFESAYLKIHANEKADFVFIRETLNNDYILEPTKTAWKIWQASQAQQAQVVEELVKALEYIEQWSHQLIKENKSRMVNDLIYVRAKSAIAKVKGSDQHRHQSVTGIF